MSSGSSGHRGIPPAEIEVDAALARRLLREQHPDLASLPIHPLGTGWDNVLFRLGDGLTLRLPRRASAARLLRHEQAWVPVLAPRLPIPVPTPVRLGRATEFYPWPFSVLPWFPGEGADRCPPADGEARRFAEFLRALHQPAPADAPPNPFRGGPLAQRQASGQERIDRLRARTDRITPTLIAIWEEGLSAPSHTERCWLHGDLHAQNVLVGPDDRISGVIDWGDITAGDVATDLAAIWALFESAEARRRVLDDVAPDEATRARAMGWAALFGFILLDAGLVDSARHAHAGERVLARLSADRR